MFWDLDIFRDLRSNTRVIDAPKLFGIHLALSGLLWHGLGGPSWLPWAPISLLTISLRTSLESLALRIGILELEEGRGAANNAGNMDRLSSTWDQLAGLALIFFWRHEL